MSTVFYNRQTELEFLRSALQSNKSELLLLYGRRGVGKSALLEKALAQVGGRTLYYRATRRTLPMQLENLSEAARETFRESFVGSHLGSTQDFLELLSHQAAGREQEQLTLVIDELSYLAEVDPGFLTTFQHWWDQNKRRPNLNIVLSGSYVSFMERNVLDIQAPLYHRRTGALLLKPLDYFEASLFFPSYSHEDKMAIYAILGGMPIYLEQFQPSLGLEANVRQTILKAHTFLSEEPEWLLREDLRKEIVYGSILRALAQGNRKPSDIARAIGKDSAQEIFPRLTTLVEMGLVVREVPVTETRRASSRNSLYLIADSYLDFWHRYVDPARALVERGLGGQIWERRIAPTLHELIARPTFERAARQFLWRRLVDGGVPEGLAFVEVGSWWSAHQEIDVVALDEQQKATLFGSCKWTHQPLDVSHYADLRQASEASGLAGVAEPFLALFSRSGFTRRLKELARGSNRLWLVDLVGMYRE